MGRGRGTAVPTIDRSFADLCVDDRAFTSWYDEALPRVYGFVYARTGGDSALAEDVTAMAFMEAVRARRSFTGRSDPVTWICSIARNRLIDHFRRESRDRARRLRLIVTESEVRDEAWRQLDARDAALSALAALPSDERLALTLRYIDGYSVRETAGLIGRSEAGTESLLARARERVRTAFPGGPG
ncbi:MAG TPA: RNA polymerase sigma factor [Candidatus Limnocylindrales bacterium]